MKAKLDEITQYFHSHAKLFSEIPAFSDKPGIYAIHFMGNAFPIHSLKPMANEIIYIGKTQKSQASRDANTHFASGKTGSSTLRRSIGALMCNGAKLNPIPRSSTEQNDKRFTNYMFDEEGERRITDWMTKSLGVSFYEFVGSAKELDKLETILINALKPMLNIDHKNQQNHHLETILSLRAECVRKAKTNEHYKPTSSQYQFEPQRQHTQIKSGKSKGLYLDVWSKALPTLKEKLEKNEDFSAQIHDHVFTDVGDRKKYSFKLELYDAMVQNNIGGSAVARDLYATLTDSKDICKLLENKRVVFRLSKDFYFKMQIL